MFKIKDVIYYNIFKQNIININNKYNNFECQIYKILYL